MQLARTPLCALIGNHNALFSAEFKTGNQEILCFASAIADIGAARPCFHVSVHIRTKIGANDDESLCLEPRVIVS